MRRPAFTEGVFVALAMATGATLLVSVLTSLLSFELVVLTTISVLTLAYTGYLLSRSSARVGRITTIAAIGLTILALWSTGASSAVYLLAHVTAIWLVRSVFFYRSPLLCIMDVGLQMCAVGIAQWAAVQSSSTFLVVWAFFLMQALFCTSPGLKPEQSKLSRSSLRENHSQFDRSARNAESALKKLFNR